jgi:hypothetical protein
MVDGDIMITDTHIIRIMDTTIPITTTRTALIIRATTDQRASQPWSRAHLPGAVTTMAKLTVLSGRRRGARSVSFSGITDWQ